MPGPIQIKESTMPSIRVTDSTMPRIEPADLAKALGAEPAGERIEPGLAPITLFAVRQEMFRRLQSQGAPPEPAAATHRLEISMSDDDWRRLGALTAAITSADHTPSHGRLASVLLRHALDIVTTRIAEAPNPASTPLAQELAALADDRRSE